jgi:hypothetical protein
MSKTDKPRLPSRAGLLQADQRTSRAIRDKLGEQLRVMCGKPEEEPLPENLLYLVRQIGQPRSRRRP